MTRTLGAVRHDCLRCGGSCHGVIVDVGPDEREPLMDDAAALGVERPLDGDRLRQQNGGCVFLDAHEACRLHAAFGPSRKPRACRQYPVVAVRAAGALRVGVDPTCYTHRETWRTGSLLTAEALAVVRVDLPPPEAQAEASLLALLGAPGQTVSDALARLVGARAAPPPGLTARLVTLLREADLARHVADPGTAPRLRLVVGRIVAASEGWAQGAPPAWPSFAPEDEAYVLDATRRLLFLRLGGPLPVAGVALLALSGAVLAAWSSDPATFGRTYAGWLRAIRSPGVLAALLPNPARLRWLATGR